MKNIKFSSLAYDSLNDFIFGDAKSPVKFKNGMVIGGGTVYPEINFTLPPMLINKETMPEVIGQYKEIINGVCQRAMELFVPGFVAEIEELPGCMTQAETLDDVFKSIEDARQLWIKTAYDEGQDIPLPRDMEIYTGKFVVRIPRGLHRDLAHAAKRQGVSLNQYVASLLASGVSRDIMGTQVTAMEHLILWPPSARVWGSTEKLLDYKQLLTISQGEAIGKE